MEPRLLTLVLAFVALSGVLAERPAAAAGAPPPGGRRLSTPVRIESGAVAGRLTSDGVVAVFRGVPYAAPPVADLRWKAPQPPAAWTGVREAFAFGPACPQAEGAPGGERVARASEDCLYLNVWAPAKPRGRRLPVMVWFHGGGFSSGTASSSRYDGEALARRGAVVVTFNSRLGPLGYLAHPLLAEESGRATSGNYGLLDQIAALRWVKANAAAFGGSPDRVAVFGQGAGAVSIGCLLVSPQARGLFHAAILQSGSVLSLPRIGVTRFLSDAPPGEESMEDVGELVTRRLGCDHEDNVLAALRSRSVEEILAASRPTASFFGVGLRFGPVIDRWLIPDRPSVLLQQRTQQRVPVMIGATADEGLFFANALRPSDVASYRRFLRTAFRDRADEVFSRYPVTRNSEVKGVLARVIGEAGFLAPARQTARALVAAGHPTYLYFFTRQRNGARGPRAASHGAELPYVFHTLGRHRDGVDDVDRELSLLMMGYWVRFARSGNPNGDNAPAWSRYTRAGDLSLELGEQVEPRSGVCREACDFFDRVSSHRAPRHRTARPSPKR